MAVKKFKWLTPIEPPVLVALIGADTSGKTTLVRELEKLGRKFIYKGGPTKNVFEGLEKAEECLKNLPTDGAPYYLCEHINNVDAVVYAPFFGYAPTPEEEKAVMEFEERWKHKLVLAFCCAPLQELERRIEKRGDPFITKDQLPEILKRYEERLRQTVLNCVIVDTFSYRPPESALALDLELRRLIECSLPS